MVEEDEVAPFAVVMVLKGWQLRVGEMGYGN